MEYDLKREVKIFMVFDMLGDLVRTGPQLWYVSRERLEDVKDHVFDLRLILKLLRRYFPLDLDYDKMDDYILFHDLPEVITGDITKFEGIPSDEKKRVTELATDYLTHFFANLFNVRSIIHGYESRVDIEAKIVHMLDKVHSASTFIKYQSEKPIDVDDPRIIPELRHHPFVKKRIQEGMDVADIFYEFHLKSVFISDEECQKYGISRENADRIVRVIREYITEMYNQKLDGTLFDYVGDFPKDAMIYNRKRIWSNDAMEKIYNKLVRDNIPAIIEADGEIPVYRVLDDKEYWDYLLLKDTEELEEVKSATSTEERKKELADKLELLRAMAEYNGFTLQDIVEEADKKKKRNGGFTRKLLLLKVIDNNLGRK